MNSVFAQYEDLPSPQFAVINLSLRLRLITANFGLDNSSYRAQPHSIIVKYLSPSRRREAPCEGTNSPRLFTPGERKALAKSKVHQLPRARDYGSWVDLLTDLKNMAVC